MEENDKYYTPDLHEFRKGFVYERFYPLDNIWGDIRMGYPTMYFLDHFNNVVEYFSNSNSSLEGGFRVKYLDQEDVESMGWKMSTDVSNSDRKLYFKDVDYRGEAKTCGILHIPRSNWCLIYLSHKGLENYVMELPEHKLTVTSNTVFAGVIKNISELKDLLIKLDIKTDYIQHVGRSERSVAGGYPPRNPFLKDELDGVTAEMFAACKPKFPHSLKTPITFIAGTSGEFPAKPKISEDEQ